jgi:uncharacterized damage-inducible protein DinB
MAITKKDILINQMRACFDEENWFVTVQRALDGLTPPQAEWKSEGNNSIHEIVNHLIFWNQRYLNIYKNVPVSKVDSNDYTFTNESTGNNIGDWKSTVDKLYEVFTRWIELLNEADDTKLESQARKDQQGTWFDVLANINIHNAYHIGQIVTLRKQQGSWDPSKGVS